MSATGDLLLTKFDVAERQLNQAITLFFEGGDPVSIHTIAEAAAQILYDTRASYGGQSKLRDSDIIKPDYKKQWLASLATSRNFFKHADRDAADTHEFKEEFNHFSLLDAVTMYLSAKREWTPETIVFVQWFGVTYPQFVRQDSFFAALLSNYRASSTADLHERKSLSAQALKELRSGSHRLPGVALSMGLPK